MSRVLIVSLIIVLVMTGCGADSPEVDELELMRRQGLDILDADRTEESYNIDEGLINGDVILLAGYNDNMDDLHSFISNVNASIEDSVRVVSFTFEGDAIITDLSFDGDKIYYLRDNTRDKWGTPLILSGFYTSLDVRKDRRNSNSYMDIYLHDNDKEIIATSIEEDNWDVD